MEKLKEHEIEEKLESLEGWVYEEGAIHTSFSFSDFKEAFTAMTRMAFEFERAQHHPDWSNVYNELDISLSTHDAGGVTEKDIEMARIIDQLVREQ